VQLAGPAPALLDTKAAAWAEFGDFAQAAEIAKQAANAADLRAAKEMAESDADRDAASRETDESRRQQLLAEAKAHADLAAKFRNCRGHPRASARLYEQHHPYRDTRPVSPGVLGK